MDDDNEDKRKRVKVEEEKKETDGRPSIHDQMKANQESYQKAKDERWAKEDAHGYNSARIRRRIAAAKQRKKDMIHSEVYAYMKEKEVKDAHKEMIKETEKMKSEGKIKDIRSYFK